MSTTSTSRRPIAKVAESERLRLADDPNVTTIGYGLRLRGGRPEYQACLKYRVRKKLSGALAIREAGSAPIPTEVEGYPTDVVEVVVAHAHKNEGPPTGSRGSHVEDPLIGGTSTTVLSDWHSFPTGFGTIGGICFDVSSPAPMAISNAHVWGTDTGKNCIQPWIPTEEYLVALLKLVACGPFAFPLDVTMPSPLTAGLAAAAAGAWALAAASDAEDPSRWGQRTGTVPAAGVLTTSETIRLTAPLPDMPFAGRAYSTNAHWDYTRNTTAGNLSTSIEAARANEHVLIGKLVWTEHPQYQPGARVQICAEVITTAANPALFFVVAKCFPNADPSRVVYRVLTPGQCKLERRAIPICVQDFPDPLPNIEAADFVVRIGPFWFESGEKLRSVAAPPSPPAAGRPLALPKNALRVVCPPGNRVSFQFGSLKRKLQIVARNSAGVQVATATTTGAADLVTLQAAEMVDAIIAGAQGEGLLYSVCVTKDPNGPQVNEKIHRLHYMGFLDLDLAEKKGDWNIMLSVQSRNLFPPDADPSQSARVLAGVESGVGVFAAGCIAVLLLDNVFHVI
jgi:hypothetical protein